MQVGIIRELRREKGVINAKKISEAAEKALRQFFCGIRPKTATYPIARPRESGNIVICVYT
jgi:hypothetical protein